MFKLVQGCLKVRGACPEFVAALGEKGCKAEVRFCLGCVIKAVEDCPIVFVDSAGVGSICLLPRSG